MAGEFKTVYLKNTKGRVLVVSDIHGHYEYLLRLLEKADFGDGDLLIVVGDMVEKGPDSLKAVRYLMRLCAEGRAIVLMGNVDNRVLWQLDDLTDSESYASFLDYLNYMRAWTGSSFFDEMFAEIGKKPQTADEVLSMITEIRVRFEPELSFIRGLPTMLVSDKYIFIHGGIYESESAFLSIPDGEKNRHRCLKFDKFLSFVRENGLEFNRQIVVGHWPVVNNDRKMRVMNPSFDREIRVISIDGGCGINRDGQLNLLVFPNIDCDIEEIEGLYYDGFPVCVAEDDQLPSESSVNICWGDSDVRIVGLDGGFAEVEHISSKRVLWLPLDYLYEASEPKIGDVTVTSSCTDYRLPVSVGDELSVIRITPHGVLAKKNGVVGWYYGGLRKE